MSKNLFTILLIFLTSALVAQHNYLGYEQSIFALKITRQNSPANFTRYEGIHKGGFLQLSAGEQNAFSIGMGLDQINYQKEWRGNFPETNQYGIAQVNGNIGYWSFPVSYSWTTRNTRRSYYSCGGYRRDRFRSGIRITYTPSFLGRTSFSATTEGGADLQTFLSTFQSNEQTFQHSLTVGLPGQLILFDKFLRLGLEPYAGIGSGYFKETGTNISMISYGLRINISLRAKLPHIRIEKEITKTNNEEKKKQLEQKQKEIEEKLKQNPTNPR